MAADLPPWGDGWAVGLRVWVERAGRAVIGCGRMELLEGIDRWHSISAAARQMGLSYRRAWGLVQTINAAAGEPLVTAAPGGTRGGGAELTPAGRRAVAVFRDLHGHLERAAAAELARLVRPAGAPTLHVAAAVSLEEALGQLLTDYALLLPAVRVRAVFGASDELAEHILAGAPADLFLTADTRHLDRLKRVVSARTVVAENGLAAVGPADRQLPIRKPADLVRAAAGRVALAEPDCPLGRYTRAYLDGLGLYAAIVPAAVLVENSRAVVAAVRAGQAAVGLAYSSDALRADGCRLLFQARNLPEPIRYSAALVGRGADPAPAEALLQFLASPAAAKRFRRCGFRPPPT
jgi:molybdenum ABC transporter molybdate-binding protein